MDRRAPSAGNRGQAIAEYILLIGLIIIFIIVVLYEFRDSVDIYTNRVIAWIEGQDTPPQPVAPPPTPAPRPAPAPPPPPPPTPPPTPMPTPTPTPEADDWATYMNGRWCGEQFIWVATKIGPNQIRAYRIYENGYVTGTEIFNLTETQPGQVREWGVGNPRDIGDAQRLTNNTMRSPPGNGQLLYRC